VHVYTENGHFAFLSPPWGGEAWATYAVYLRLIGKRALFFLLVIIKLRSLGVTAEVLYTSEYRLKIGFFCRLAVSFAKISPLT